MKCWECQKWRLYKKDRKKQEFTEISTKAYKIPLLNQNQKVPIYFHQNFINKKASIILDFYFWYCVNNDDFFYLILNLYFRKSYNKKENNEFIDFWKQCNWDFLW